MDKDLARAVKLLRKVDEAYDNHEPTSPRLIELIYEFLSDYDSRQNEAQDPELEEFAAPVEAEVRGEPVFADPVFKETLLGKMLDLLQEPTETLLKKVQDLLQRPLAEWNTVCPLCDHALTDGIAKVTVTYSDTEKDLVRVHVACNGPG